MRQHPSLNEKWQDEEHVFITLPAGVTLFVMIKDKHKMSTSISETDNSVVVLAEDARSDEESGEE